MINPSNQSLKINLPNPRKSVLSNFPSVDQAGQWPLVKYYNNSPPPPPWTRLGTRHTSTPSRCSRKRILSSLLIFSDFLFRMSKSLDQIDYKKIYMMHKDLIKSVMD